MKIALEERLAKARELRRLGYNCAQTVLMVFPDITHLDDETAARLAMALGSGVAARGEICGVANAMAIVQGLNGDHDPASKGAATKKAATLLDTFAAKNDGCLTCRQLKNRLHKPCNDLILEGIEIIHHSHEA